VPDEAVLTSGVTPVGRARLASELRELGVRPGGVLMVHTRVSALGWVVGGTGAVVHALLDRLGPDGTLMAYAGWEDDPYGMDSWPEAWQAAYEADLPPFDPHTAEAVHANGRLPERIRTWPGAVRSRQPEAGIVAVGRRAAWIVADHPLDDAYGAGSPLAKLVEADGQVLALGAPLSTLTLLHHAEATARVDGKRRVVYRMPLLVDGRTIWREFRDIDTA
jgi:aminoglycoside 3-N-acetyltransferase